MASGSCSQRRVEPSMSVNKNVTVPAGRATHVTLGRPGEGRDYEARIRVVTTAEIGPKDLCGFVAH